MKEHYQLTELQMEDLKEKGVTIADLFNMVGMFKADQAPVSKISLMYYIDTHGDFTERRNKNDLVAMAVFENLTVKEKIEIGEYMNWIEEN